MIAHILTKNNQATIQKTIESVRYCDQILIADRGSTDQTVKLAQSLGAKVFHCPEMTRSEARNKLPRSDEWQFYIEPWEILSQGHRPKLSGNAAYASVLQGNTLSKEVRYWKGDLKFINPAYEKLDVTTEQQTPTILYSTGRNDLDELEIDVDQWRVNNPTLAAPHYYKACILLSKGNWAEFLRVSEHYMFLEKRKCVSATMNRYYFALGQLIYRRKAIPALQNVNLCLCERPLMAEFWCLMGDVYYHLLKKFKEASEFYENAMILGSKRLKTDIWPMDISKYRKYPEKMQKSCEMIIKKASFFGS